MGTRPGLECITLGKSRYRKVRNGYTEVNLGLNGIMKICIGWQTGNKAKIGLTGILLSELSKMISTKAEMTLGPVPSWRRDCRCSGRRLLNSSLRTN